MLTPRDYFIYLSLILVWYGTLFGFIMSGRKFCAHFQKHKDKPHNDLTRNMIAYVLFSSFAFFAIVYFGYHWARTV